MALRRRPDAELMDAAVGGDPVAFSEIYRRFHTPVYAFCLSRLMRPGSAEDATQEVFVRLLSARPGTIDKPLSWLYGVARHVCIDISRRSDREFASDLGHLTVADPFDTETHVTAREDGERIAIALRGLNPRYRTALVMHEMHAQSASEIAKALEIGLGATYTLLSRSRVAFEVAYTRAEGLSAPCKHALGLLHRGQAQSLSANEALGLERHLADCTSCARESRRVTRAHQWNVLRSALTVPALSRAWLHTAHRFDPVATWFAPEASQSIVASLGAAITVAAIGAVSILPPLGIVPKAAPLTEPRPATATAHQVHDDFRAPRHERVAAQGREPTRDAQRQILNRIGLEGAAPGGASGITRTQTQRTSKSRGNANSGSSTASEPMRTRAQPAADPAQTGASGGATEPSNGEDSDAGGLRQQGRPSE
jgi:RNA polymerase sigma-70 factor (ECF subfamily)